MSSCNQVVWSSYKEQCLIADSAGKMYWAAARKITEGHKVHSHAPSLFLTPTRSLLYYEIVGLQTSNFLTFPFSKTVHLYWWQCSRGHSTAVVKLRFRAIARARWWGMERKVQSSLNLTLHDTHRIQGQCETILWHLKSSLPLCSRLLWSLCLFLPAVLSFCVFPQCLHFEPNSINLSGKLQMFWLNYANHGEIKLQKAWSPSFIS